MTKRHSIAVHEAGHAVASFFHQRRLRYVTVRPENGTLGHVAYPRPRANWQATTGTALSHMESALAGYCAQREFGYRPSLSQWEGDRATAADCALAIAAEGEADLWLRLAHMRAQRLVHVRRKEIEIVANRLMEVDTINITELRSLILGPVASIQIK